MLLMNYQAVIFDLFGTLTGNYPLQQSTSTLAEMATVLSLPSWEFISLWTVETWPMRATGKFTDLASCIEYIGRLLDVQLCAEKVKAAAQLWHIFAQDLLNPRPHAIETLQALKNSGYKIGLISDCSAEVQLCWQNTLFARTLDVSILSCEVGLKKPDPRIYQLACNHLKVLPQHCLYVGDGSSHELTGASQIGMHPILIRVPDEEKSDALRPDLEDWHGPAIDTLKDVLTLLEL